jgi:hypothetical protein
MPGERWELKFILYANPDAVEGYRTGEFPDGAVIVYELVATKEQGGVISEADRRRVDIMSEDKSHSPQRHSQPCQGSVRNENVVLHEGVVTGFDLDHLAYALHMV